jgi:hypothetical protein
MNGSLKDCADYHPGIVGALNYVHCRSSIMHECQQEILANSLLCKLHEVTVQTNCTIYKQ